MSPTPTYQPAPRSGLTTALVTGAFIALAAANIYLFVQIDRVRTDLADTQKSLKTQTAELGSLRDTSTVSRTAQMKHIEELKAELENARTQARSSANQAKTESTARAEQLARQLEAAQNKLQQQLSTEISGVRQSTEAANTKIADVSTDVGSVKTNLASTTAELQKTIADLKSTRGDLGIQSGLIATNANELAALKRLGERNYFEFKIGKTKDRTRVGDIMVKLKNADMKKNKYTIEVLADDKVTEKKDKNINEPVQFYTSKARQPYELVVNQVQKNLIVGYLSTPKEQSGR